MKINVIFIILGLTMIFGCGHTSNENNEKNNTNNERKSLKVIDDFSGYLNNFKKIELPITIKGCNISADRFKQFDGSNFKKYANEYSLAYGQIPTNGNYIATITLDAADCYLPVLTTYKPNGQVINKKTIAIGGCGSDCGFSCEEFMTLKKDFSFYTSDTVASYACDSLGNEIPGTYEYYVIYMKGKLLNNGKIETTDQIKQPLQGRKK
jgi:hypothetical protein